MLAVSENNRLHLHHLWRHFNYYFVCYLLTGSQLSALIISILRFDTEIYPLTEDVKKMYGVTKIKTIASNETNIIYLHSDIS
jgi:hypothetical protein